MWLLVAVQCISGPFGYGCHTSNSNVFFPNREICKLAAITIQREILNTEVRPDTYRTYINVMCLEASSDGV